MRVPLPATTCHEGKRCASKTDDSDVDFGNNSNLKLSDCPRPQMLGEKIADERTVAKRHVVADMVAAFE